MVEASENMNKVEDNKLINHSQIINKIIKYQGMLDSLAQKTYHNCMLEQFQINLGYFLKNKDNNNNSQLSDYIKICIIQEKKQMRISINNKKNRIKSMLKMYGNQIKNIMKSSRKIILLLKNWKKSTKNIKYNYKGY